MEMQYELLHFRSLQPNDFMDSRTLLYAYSKYRKDREEAAAAALMNKGKKRK